MQIAPLSKNSFLTEQKHIAQSKQGYHIAYTLSDKISWGQKNTKIRNFYSR